jgi:hypothetical protein
MFSRRISVRGTVEFGSIFVRRSRYQANNNESSSMYLSFLPAPPVRRCFLPGINEINLLDFIEVEPSMVKLMKI